jgi:mono/diheme cytochrome c family protein
MSGKYTRTSPERRNMQLSRPLLSLSGTALLIAACVGLQARLVHAQQSQAKRSAAALSGDKEQIERGKYLVENVAMCGECHTPRDDNGNLKMDAWLQGGPIWIMPVHHIRDWADHVPPLAGLPGLTTEEMERVLEQGMGPEGEALRPPMHIYHMNPTDAKAIIAYLNSLPRPIH